MADNLRLYDSASTFEANESTIRYANIITKGESYYYVYSQGEYYNPANPMSVEFVTTGTHSGKTYYEVDWQRYHDIRTHQSGEFVTDLVDPDTMMGYGSKYDFGTGKLTYGHRLNIAIDWSRPISLGLQFFYQGALEHTNVGTGYPISGDTNGNDYVFIVDNPFFDYDENNKRYAVNAYLCYAPLNAPNPNAGELVLGAPSDYTGVQTHNEGVMLYDTYSFHDVHVVSSTVPGVAYVKETREVTYNMPPIEVITTWADHYNDVSGMIFTKTIKSLDVPFSAIVGDALNYLSGLSDNDGWRLNVSCGEYNGGLYAYEINQQRLEDVFSFIYDFTENKLRLEVVYGKKIFVTCSYNRYM